MKSEEKDPNHIGVASEKAECRQAASQNRRHELRAESEEWKVQGIKAAPAR